MHDHNRKYLTNPDLPNPLGRFVVVGYNSGYIFYPVLQTDTFIFGEIHVKINFKTKLENIICSLCSRSIFNNVSSGFHNKRENKLLIYGDWTFLLFNGDFLHCGHLRSLLNGISLHCFHFGI